MEALERRVRELSCWSGSLTLEPLEGGLTNTSYVATDDSGKYVVRCGGDIPIHQIIRKREYAASIAGHATGLSPEVIHTEPGILVLAHCDTVHPLGTIARDLPMRREGDRLYGPGVFDMKGGLVVMVSALKALQETGQLEGLALRLPCFLRSCVLYAATGIGPGGIGKSWEQAVTTETVQ